MTHCQTPQACSHRCPPLEGGPKMQLLPSHQARPPHRRPARLQPRSSRRSRQRSSRQAEPLNPCWGRRCGRQCCQQAQRPQRHWVPACWARCARRRGMAAALLGEALQQAAAAAHPQRLKQQARRSRAQGGSRRRASASQQVRVQGPARAVCRLALCRPAKAQLQCVFRASL